MQKPPLVWIFAGVAGSGKTTLGRLWANRLDCDFLEGDRRHSVQNITKMRNAKPLDDGDREDWLHSLQKDISHALERTRETVVTCSALKQRYRQALRISSRMQWVWLELDSNLTTQRLAQRSDHFLPPELLPSQYEIVEQPSSDEHAIIVCTNRCPADTIASLWDTATLQYPSLACPWWSRND